MDNIYVLHGEEGQLIEHKKNEIIKKYKNHDVVVYSNETPYANIMAEIHEESLFPESKVYVIHNLPILRTTSDKSGKDLGEWQALYDSLLNYTKENPVILIYDDNLDMRLKINKVFLEKAQVFQFKKLSKDDLLQWSEKYCRLHKHPFSQDGRQYFYELMDLWTDVPVHFLKTEFDRLFLFLKDEEQITMPLLAKEGSDFGSKNIFKFMDAFYEKDIERILEIMPFVLQRKEFDRFFAYLENQLSLQIMVYECGNEGMSAIEVHRYLEENGMKVKAYPVKLAHQRNRFLRINDLKQFLIGMYDIVINMRSGINDENAFARLCMRYCKRDK